MIFQNVEFYETDKYQYLLIHKNGSSSILKAMEKESFKVTHAPSNKIRWTVIRDPYERFISKLNYDLKKQKIDINQINIKNNFTSYHHNTAKYLGNVNHSSSQIPYIINTCINWYIDIRDLNIFLQMHFDQEIHINQNENNLKIDKILEENIKEKLHLDYFIYNQIKSSPFLWQWQKGRIF